MFLSVLVMIVMMMTLTKNCFVLTSFWLLQLHVVSPTRTANRVYTAKHGATRTGHT